MPWALLQRNDSLKDSLCHPHKSHSLYQAVFSSLESVAIFECIVQVKRGHTFSVSNKLPELLFSVFLRERYRNISFNRHPEKMPDNLSLLCKNQIIVLQPAKQIRYYMEIFVFLWDVLSTDTAILDLGVVLSFRFCASDCFSH